MSDTPSAYPPSLSPGRTLVVLFTFLAVCYFWALGHPPLVDPDEPVYGEVGKLMAHSHGFAPWWTPHYNGAMWFDKPPVTYWIVGLSMRLFGVSELAARLPCTLAGLLLVWLTVSLARRMFPDSKWTPVMAGLLIGTCVQTLILTHAVLTDMFFTCALTVAVWKAWKWLESGRRMAIWLSGLAVGLAVLIKGPVAIVLVGGLLLIYLLLVKEPKRLLSGPLWGALLIALAVAAPWYVSMYQLHGQFFVRSFLEAQNIGRFLNAEHPKTSSPLFFIPILLAGLLPWTFAFAPAMVTSFQRMREGSLVDLFALVWIALVFVFFSASQSKLVTYIFPLYPVAACVTAYWICELARTRAVISLGLAARIVVGGIAFAATDYAGISWLGGNIVVLLLLVVPVLTLAATHRYRMSKGHSRSQEQLRNAALIALAWPGLFFAIAFGATATGKLWTHPDPKSISAIDVGRAVAANSNPGDTVYALTFDKPSLVYYSDRHIVFTDNQEQVGPILSRAPYPLCVTKPDIIESLQRKHLLGPFKTMEHTGKQVVLIQCVPPDRGGS